MSRRTRLLSLSLAVAAALAWIVLAVRTVGFGSRDRGDRQRPRVEAPPAEPPVAPRSLRSVPRTPIEPATVSARETAAPSEWPPPRAFTARCRAHGGTCPAGCTALAGGRCLDPCFIHTAECSRDCTLPDDTCGFPPPDTE